MREGFKLPIGPGQKGVILRIQKGVEMEDSLYYVLFEVTFTGGLSLRYSGGRGCRLPGSVLINIKFKEGGAGRWEKRKCVHQLKKECCSHW